MRVGVQQDSRWVWGGRWAAASGRPRSSGVGPTEPMVARGDPGRRFTPQTRCAPAQVSVFFCWRRFQLRSTVLTAAGSPKVKLRLLLLPVSPFRRNRYRLGDIPPRPELNPAPLTTFPLTGGLREAAFPFERRRAVFVLDRVILDETSHFQRSEMMLEALEQKLGEQGRLGSEQPGPRQDHSPLTTRIWLELILQRENQQPGGKYYPSRGAALHTPPGILAWKCYVIFG